VLPWTHRAFQPRAEVTEPFVTKNIFGAFPNHHRMAYTHNGWANILLRQFSNAIEELTPREKLFIESYDTFISNRFRNDDDIAAVSWVLKKNKIPWLVGADMTVPALALAYGVGRLGCHFAGDGDWGAVTTVPWGVAYTKAIVGWADPTTGIPYGPGVVVHPTPIYEFLQGVLVFGILWSLRKKGFAAGTVTWLYLILAGLMRFMVEFWRINPAVGFGLSEAQLFSLLLIVAGVVMLVMRPARRATQLETDVDAR